MGVPNLSYKATNTTLEEAPTILIEQKFNGLNKYIGDETDVRCEVEFEKVTNSKSGMIYRVEANLWLRGELYRAESTMESFEAAVDETEAELNKRLRRAHKKQNSLFKRGGRAIKQMLQRG